MTRNIIKALNKLFKKYADLCLEDEVDKARSIRYEIENWMNKLEKADSQNPSKG